jgi:hypothetical protein
MLFQIAKKGNAAPIQLKTSHLSAQGWSEKKLENYLGDYLASLIGEDLWVIRQSKPFQPEVDVLALDRQGDLCFFELKKVSTDSENLLQVMRYSQSAACWSIDELDHLFGEYCIHKKQPYESLLADFCKHFGYDNPSLWEQRIGQAHHLVVIADGTDDDAIQAVAHWQKHGLDIQLWPFRIHEFNSTSFKFELPDLFIKGRQVSRNEPGIFLINTNRKSKSSSPEEEFMLQHKCALTTGDDWVPMINRILSGSKVLLYANKEGIKAIGIATAEKRNDVMHGEPARPVKLRDFQVLSKPVNASEIRTIAGVKNYPLLQTLRRLPDEFGQKLWQTSINRG